MYVLSCTDPLWPLMSGTRVTESIRRVPLLLIENLHGRRCYIFLSTDSRGTFVAWVHVVCT